MVFTSAGGSVSDLIYRHQRNTRKKERNVTKLLFFLSIVSSCHNDLSFISDSSFSRQQ